MSELVISYSFHLMSPVLFICYNYNRDKNMVLGLKFCDRLITFGTLLHIKGHRFNLHFDSKLQKSDLYLILSIRDNQNQDTK
jgi:hypothetical protein